MQKSKEQSISKNKNLLFEKQKRDLFYDLSFIHSKLLFPTQTYDTIFTKDDYALTSLNKPFVCLGKVSLIFVINFGQRPNKELTNFYKNSYVIPINYKVKRLYYTHNRTESQFKEMFYTCKVTIKKNMPFYTVIADDGLKLSGSKGFFSELSNLFNFQFEFKNVDDFFGLTEPGIQNEIDK